MKKRILFYIVLLVIGLSGGYLAGWIITNNKMQVEAHDNVVRELSELSKDLQDAAAEWYAGRAYNIRGELFEKGIYCRDCADQTVYFVAEFLSSYSDYRQINGKLFTFKEEQDIRSGKAIPTPSNKEYFLQVIKTDAQRVAETFAEEYGR